MADPHWQCTHQFDLAGLAVAHATRDDEQRQYDIEVPPATSPAVGGRCAWRDGELLLEWTITYGGGLTAPSPFTEAPWRGGFIKWADRHSRTRRRRGRDRPATRV